MNAEVTKVLLEMAESLKRLAECISKTDEPKKEETAVTLEQVRGVLAKKSQEGHTAEVRALLQKYGADHLSDVSPEHYEEIIKDAEGM